MKAILLESTKNKSHDHDSQDTGILKEEISRVCRSALNKEYGELRSQKHRRGFHRATISEAISQSKGNTNGIEQTRRAQSSNVEN